MKKNKKILFAALFCMGVLTSCDVKNEDILFQQTKKQLHIEYNQEKESKNISKDNKEKFKAVWVPVMEYNYILQNKSNKEFENEAEKMIENISNDGYNAIFLHVRAYGDAYYKTDLCTKGSYLTDDSIDVLAYIADKAHEKNIEVHAWINPLRCQSESGMEKMSDDYTIKKWYADSDSNGKYIVDVNGTYWLNPAYEEVRKYIADVSSEICRNYSIEGLHIDDFFYPTTDENFDRQAFSESGYSSLAEFRLQQTNLLVESVYDAVKNADNNIIFSISPQGNMKGNYNSQYSDVKKWCSESGYCDMIIPQLYYGFKNETCPFTDMVQLWRNLTTCKDVSLCIGICNYKDGLEDKFAGTGINEWIENRNITSQETEYVLNQENIYGYSIYSYTAKYHKKQP